MSISGVGCGIGIAAQLLFQSGLTEGFEHESESVYILGGVKRYFKSNGTLSAAENYIVLAERGFVVRKNGETPVVGICSQYTHRSEFLRCAESHFIYSVGYSDHFQCFSSPVRKIPFILWSIISEFTDIGESAREVYESRHRYPGPPVKRHAVSAV